MYSPVSTVGSILNFDHSDGCVVTWEAISSSGLHGLIDTWKDDDLCGGMMGNKDALTASQKDKYGQGQNVEEEVTWPLQGRSQQH